MTGTRRSQSLVAMMQEIYPDSLTEPDGELLKRCRRRFDNCESPAFMGKQVTIDEVRHARRDFATFAAEFGLAMPPKRRGEDRKQ